MARETNALSKVDVCAVEEDRKWSPLLEPTTLMQQLHNHPHTGCLTPKTMANPACMVDGDDWDGSRARRLTVRGGGELMMLVWQRLWRLWLHTCSRLRARSSRLRARPSCANSVSNSKERQSMYRQIECLLVSPLLLQMMLQGNHHSHRHRQLVSTA
jgi:hypothetical protein